MRKRLALIIFLLVALGAAKERYQVAGPVRLDRDGERWAEHTLKKMSLEEKVGQLFMVWARVDFLNQASPDMQRYLDTISKYHIGGFVVTVALEGQFLLRNEPYEAAMLTNSLQRASDVPLIFAADFERGLAMRLNGTTGFPHAMAFGAAANRDNAFNFGRITAEEARAIGVHWNFYPDADVNSNPENPIINTRAFGEDPQQVSELVTAYIAGARGAGMLTTAKHFPGHGDVATDTHLAFAQVTADRQRLEKIELAPFRAAIAAGVDSVMVGHLNLPVVDPDPNRPAVISEPIITGLLKQEMKFDGLVVTDAMDMNALMRIFGGDSTRVASGRAAVEAIKAGVDLVLIPADLDGAYNGVLNAVRRGEIPESRIDASVLKLLKTKASLGLHRARFVDIDALSTFVARPENLAIAQKVADDAVTLVRYDGQFLPVRPNGTSAPSLAYTTTEETRNRIVAIVFTDDVRSDWGRAFERQLKFRAPDANVIFIDPRIATSMTAQTLEAVRQAKTVIAAVYVIPSAGRVVRKDPQSKALAGVSASSASLLAQVLQQANDKTMVVAMGNPYAAADYPYVKNYMCTFSHMPVSETSAIKALFGEIPMHGHLPVTIPGVAARGTGLERPANSGGL